MRNGGRVWGATAVTISWPQALCVILAKYHILIPFTKNPRGALSDLKHLSPTLLIFVLCSSFLPLGQLFLLHHFLPPRSSSYLLHALSALQILLFPHSCCPSCFSSRLLLAPVVLSDLLPVIFNLLLPVMFLLLSPPWYCSPYFFLSRFHALVLLFSP